MEAILQQILSEMRELRSDVILLKEGQARLEQKVATLDEKVDNLTLETRSNFKYTSDKFDEQLQTFDIVSKELTVLRGSIDYLGGKTGRHDIEINQLQSYIRKS